MLQGCHFIDKYVLWGISFNQYFTACALSRTWNWGKYLHMIGTNYGLVRQEMSHLFLQNVFSYGISKWPRKMALSKETVTSVWGNAVIPCKAIDVEHVRHTKDKGFPPTICAMAVAEQVINTSFSIFSPLKHTPHTLPHTPQRRHHCFLLKFILCEGFQERCAIVHVWRPGYSFGLFPSHGGSWGRSTGLWRRNSGLYNRCPALWAVWLAEGIVLKDVEQWLSNFQNS